MMIKNLLVAAALLVPAIAQADSHRLSKAVEFEYGKVHIHGKGREALEQIAKEVRENPETRITVEGHAFAYNEEDSIALGQKRADAVRSLLIRYGVNPANITSVDMSREGEAGRYVDLVLEVR